MSGGHANQTAGRPPAGDESSVPLLEPSDTAVPDPPDGKWLVDDRGLEYTLFRWRKHEGYYRIEDDGKTVTLRHGIRVIVERHDEQFLYLRWYRTGPIRESLAAAPTRPGPSGPAAEAIRSTYRGSISERDALRLEPWDEGLPRGGQWRNSFAIADLNGDGHLDLVHGPPRKGPIAQPIVFLGDGAGRWRFWKEAKFPPLPYDYGAVAAGDLDGDGRIDLVLAAHLSGIFALRNDGAGTFTSWSLGLPVRSRSQDGRPLPPRGPALPKTPAAGPTRFTSRALTLGDWNRDGRLDILALSEGPTSVRGLEDRAASPLGKVIFLNRGDGNWQPLHGPGAITGDSIRAVDLDGDGRLDFVTDSRVVGSAELLNYGEPAGGWSVASLPQPRGRLRVHAVAVADLDGDGRLDLALTFQSQEAGEVRLGLDVFFGGADRSWRRVSIWAPDARTAEAMTALAAGDLDGDGDQDLVALTAKGETWLFINDGRGDFALDRSPEADPDREHLHCAGYAVRIADLDGDGRSEVVTAFAGEPGSDALVRQSLPPRCRAGGALRVFKVMPATASVGRTR